MLTDPVHQRSKEELEQAVSTLMAFAKKTDIWTNKPSNEKGIKKGLRNLCSFIKSCALYLRKKEDANLAKAIKVIKQHAKWLEQAQRKGSKEDKELAKVTQAAVDRFNIAVEELNKKLEKNLFSLLAKSLGTEIKPSSLKQQFLVIPGPAIMESSSSAQTLFQATFSPATGLTHLEQDSFLMRAIRVIEKERLLPPGSLYEEVRQGKIASQTDQGQKTLLLCLDNLPGEELKLVGKSTPKSEIQYQLRSEQTGFPDGLLSTGWVLAPCLLSDNSEDDEKPSPLIRDWLREKKKLAEMLLPAGSYNAKAKERIKLARMVFEEDKSAILHFHSRVWTKLFELTGTRQEAEDLFLLIMQTFGRPDISFDQFCDLTRNINRIFLEFLPEKANGKELQTSVHELPLWAMKLGSLLEQECLPIYIHLHHFDKKTSGLTDFQMSLLILAFFQQLMFLKEMKEVGISKEQVRNTLYAILEGSLQILDGKYEGLAEHALDLAHEAESHAQVRRWRR